MRQQKSPYLVKTVLTRDGERLPVLLRRDTGVPVFDATLWVVSSLRNKGLASETITQALRSITLLYIILDREEIDLADRLAKGMFLYPGELESIVKACKSTLAMCLDSSSATVSDASQSKGLPLGKIHVPNYRRRLPADVDPSTTSIRLGYIREFLNWRINQAIFRTSAQARSDLIALRDLVDQEIKNKTPAVKGRNHMQQRMGLSMDAQKILLDIIDPGNPENPWGSTHTKLRNQVIIRCLVELGIRRGELLGLRIRDINAQGDEIEILRRPDDKNDPRLYEPNAKTRDRLLPLSASLNRLIREYIFMRREIVGGRHDFLLVANGTGDPLSKSEFNRLFHPLRMAFTLLHNLCPHLLRHTFFENLCEDLDRNGVDSESMEPILRQLGGWSESSSTPRKYTKRYAQRKAIEAGRSMQSKLRMNTQDEQSR